MANSRICSIDGCGKKHMARGWCAAHYRRWGRNADPLAGGTAPGEPLRFFTDIIVPYEGDDCLIWPYSRNNKGYAIMAADGRDVLTHRQTCVAVYGSPPTPKHQAAHLCGKGHEGCVNPRHLSWKTRSENEADKVIHGTSNRGERCGASKLTEADVREIRVMLGTRTHAEIAKLFAVSRQTVSAIHARKRWAWHEAVAGIATES